jgi:hypothetical protein
MKLLRSSSDGDFISLLSGRDFGLRLSTLVRFPEVPTLVVDLHFHNIPERKGKFGEPTNGDNATFADDNLVKMPAIVQFDRSNLIPESCLFFAFQKLSGFGRELY